MKVRPCLRLDMICSHFNEVARGFLPFLTESCWYLDISLLNFNVQTRFTKDILLHYVCEVVPETFLECVTKVVFPFERSFFLLWIQCELGLFGFNQDQVTHDQETASSISKDHTSIIVEWSSGFIRDTQTFWF